MVIFKSDPRYSKTRLRKPCNKDKGGCGKYFRPTGKFTILCDACQKKHVKESMERRKERRKMKKENKS